MRTSVGAVTTQSDEDARCTMPAQDALAKLVAELESNDYATSAGVRATATAAFLEAKALLTLREALQPKPWWRWMT